jgi:hypothetical protein
MSAGSSLRATPPGQRCRHRFPSCDERQEDWLAITTTRGAWAPQDPQLGLEGQRRVDLPVRHSTPAWVKGLPGRLSRRRLVFRFSQSTSRGLRPDARHHRLGLQSGQCSKESVVLLRQLQSLRSGGDQHRPGDLHTPVPDPRRCLRVSGPGRPGRDALPVRACPRRAAPTDARAAGEFCDRVRRGALNIQSAQRKGWRWDHGETITADQAS